MKTIYIHNTLATIQDGRKHSKIVQYLNEVLSNGNAQLREVNSKEKQNVSYIVIEEENENESDN
jgi:hypothetical protein